MTKPTTKYTPAPEVPSELQERYQAVLEVLSGQTTVSEAARRLGMPRNHFQTIMHRGLEGMIEKLSPGKAGRPAKPEREMKLEEELERLRRKTAQLEQKLAMTDKLMGLASSLLHGTTSARPRSKRKKAAVPSTDDTKDEDPASLRDVARQLDEIGLPRLLVARTLRIPESTLRRWATCAAKRRSPRSAPPPADVVEAAVADVRALRGLVGAEALSHAHPGLSRRQAADIKRETVTALERERRHACRRVVVTTPGVIRGFDAMDRGRHCTHRFVLAAGDGAVPFRTTMAHAVRYEAATVAPVLAQDFEHHGPPLVLRMDRAAAHRAPDVRRLLDAHGVLVLHGPPRYPRFYGQLERQNREHAAWLEGLDHDADDNLAERLADMAEALNTRWRRPTLGWRTAAEVWHARPIITLDRRELRARVDERARRLRESRSCDNITEDLATRLAIEHTLVQLGYLRIEIRKPVLGDSRL